MSFLNDVLSILSAEKKTVLRGFIVCFLVILPLTFLPIITDGLTKDNILRRLPVSLLYTLGLSLAVVLASVVNTRQTLMLRKKYLEKPAFKKLGWEERLDGVGSIVNELEPYLFGKAGPYYFRVNITDPAENAHKIEIIPFIEIKNNSSLQKILKKEHGFKQGRFWGQLVHFTINDLEQESFLQDKIAKLAATLEALEAKPMDDTVFNTTKPPP